RRGARLAGPVDHRAILDPDPGLAREPGEPARIRPARPDAGRAARRNRQPVGAPPEGDRLNRLRNPYLAGLAVAGAAALYPVLRPDDLTVLGLGFLTFIFITQAISWGLVGGYAGQVSFGFAAFFGTGAYTTALLWTKSGWDPVMTLPVAGLAAVVVALLVGLP